MNYMYTMCTILLHARSYVQSEIAFQTAPLPKQNRYESLPLLDIDLQTTSATMMLEPVLNFAIGYVHGYVHMLK